MVKQVQTASISTVEGILTLLRRIYEQYDTEERLEENSIPLYELIIRKFLRTNEKRVRNNLPPVTTDDWTTQSLDQLNMIHEINNL